MSHDPHFGSVIAAYALAIVVVGGMIGAIVVDYIRLKRALSLLAMPERHQQATAESSTQDWKPQASDPEGLE